MAAEKPAPTRKNTERQIRSAVSSAGSASSSRNAIDGEHRQRPELAGQVGGRALLHRLRDVLHVLRALAGGEHLPPEHDCHDQRDERDDPDDEDQGQVAPGQVHGRSHGAGGQGVPGHAVLLSMRASRPSR